MPLAYLFDLDMTLVDSSALSMLRKQQMWKAVKASIHLVRPYQAIGRYAPHEIPALLKKAGHQVGVVTNSPRWYAEDIIARFRLPIDVLIGYDDTASHKPDPEPILEALKKLKAHKASALYVGDDVGDIEASYHAGIRSVGIAWGPTSTFEFASVAPDVFVGKPSTLLRAESLDELGYVGECICDGRAFESHWGSVLRSDESPQVFALGRYFTASDPRHAGSALSAAILSLKKKDTFAPKFGKAVGLAFGPMDWAPRYIVPVPPKPSQDRNRFEAVLQAASRHLPSGSEVVLTGLKCVKEVEDYKKMDALERREAIRGAFRTGWDWNGNSILLVDDVYTTGETIQECIRVLKKSGAGEIRCLALAKDQRTFSRKQCECGRSMKIRTNSKTGEKFWGCSGYPTFCQRTQNV